MQNHNVTRSDDLGGQELTRLDSAVSLLVDYLLQKKDEDRSTGKKAVKSGKVRQPPEQNF